MTHWTETLNADFNRITKKAPGYNFSVDISSNEAGPVTFEHTDGSEISLVKSTNTGTLAVEYEPAETATAGVNLNRNGGYQGDYHHQSFGLSEPTAAFEWVLNIMEQHTKKN